MKKLKSLFICGMLSMVFASCSNQSPKAPDNQDQLQSDTSTSEMQAGYVCPMGKECGYSNVAGKCSSCGMDLVATK